MSKITKDLAKRLIELNLNPVPVHKGSKAPMRNEHQKTISLDVVESLDWKSVDIGISTGYASLNLEVLDFDLKNVDNPEEFIESYNSQLPKELLSKLVIQSTQNGGFHYLYRCDVIESNQKLARNEKGEAVIETRGIGGYIKCFPSSGYKMVQGTYKDIPFITSTERGLLFTIARQRDRLLSNDVKKKQSTEDKEYLKKFQRYNEDPQIGIDLLEEAGWEYHSTHGEWYNLSRPNSVSKDLHGGYNTVDCFFQTFSTAQDIFQERKGYNNHHLFAELKCDGDYRKAYALLYEQGWGNEEEIVEDEEGSLSFLSTFTQENEYLDQARRDEVPLGKSTGFTALDQNFLWKDNTFYFFLGLDNIGKSTILSTLMVSNNILHGDKWGISSPEALVATTRRVLIEAEVGKSINSLKYNPSEYHRVLERSRNNFFIINNEKHFTLDEVLEKGKVLYQTYGIKYFLIDPFSFYSGSGNFSDDNEVLSKIRVFCQNYCSVIIVDHPTSEFARRGSTDEGFVKMPTKYDVSGGNMKPNRCDDFVSFHRILNHADEDVRRTMQISVQKVKDKATGGKPHIAGEWTELIYETRDGFTGYWDEHSDNPIYKSIKAKEGVRQVIKSVSPEEAFL